MQLEDRVKSLQQHAVDCNPAGSLSDILDSLCILMVEDFRELVASKCAHAPFVQARTLKSLDNAIVQDYYKDD